MPVNSYYFQMYFIEGNTMHAVRWTFQCQIQLVQMYC